MDQLVITRMMRFKEWKNRSLDEMKSLIVRGHEIKADDKKALEKEGVLRSHYHLSDYDKDAIGTASQYDIMIQFQQEKSGNLSDEEE